MSKTHHPLFEPQLDLAGRPYTPGRLSVAYDTIVQCLDRDQLGDAELLATMYAGRLVYDHAEERWYINRGPYWQADQFDEIVKLVAIRLADEYQAAAAAASLNGSGAMRGFMDRARQLRTFRGVRNIVEMAKPLLAMKETWDSYPWLLACANAVVDLRTGELVENCAGYYLRAHTPTAWHGLNVPCPIWESFVLKVHNYCPQTTRFMQRVLGAAITGQPGRFLTILWGKNGFNGKTTMVEAVRDVIGPSLVYSIPAKTLLQNEQAAYENGEAPTPFMAAMRGKRMVIAAETRQNAKLDPAMLKHLTGRDGRTTRGLYGDPINYRPTDSLFLLTNFKPDLPAIDTALWRRIQLVEYNQVFSDHPDPSDPSQHLNDPNFLDRLAPEASGILAWLVRGAIDYQQSGGLCPPENVLAGTRAFQEEQDFFRHFLEQTYTRSADDRLYASQILDDYRQWARVASITAPMNFVILSQLLIAHGFSKGRDGREGIYYIGLKPKSKAVVN